MFGGWGAQGNCKRHASLLTACSNVCAFNFSLSRPLSLSTSLSTPLSTSRPIGGCYRHEKEVSRLRKEYEQELDMAHSEQSWLRQLHTSACLRVSVCKRVRNTCTRTNIPSPLSPSSFLFVLLGCCCRRTDCNAAQNKGCAGPRKVDDWCVFSFYGCVCMMELVCVRVCACIPSDG